MKRFAKLFLFSLTALVLLSACGKSPEKSIIGSWKMVANDVGGAYMEFSEDRIVFREDLDEIPETADYRMTDLQKGNFIIEFAEPGTNAYEFFFEGKFEKKNKIKIVKTEGADDDVELQLIKVKDIEKDMEKAKEEQKKEKAVKEEDTKQDHVKETDLAEKEETEVAGESTETNISSEEPKPQVTQESHQPTHDNSLHTQYLNKAEQLDQNITDEAKQTFAGQHDVQAGFHGQYYSDWDDLLNDIWKQLKAQMPDNEFEQLKANQIEWIKQKEQGFKDYPDNTASSRAMGMDFLTFETKDRVFYLIENYLK